MRVVMADWATPGTPAYLEGRIKHTKESALWLEKSVVPFVETIDELRELDWPSATTGPEKTWDRFCHDVLGFPADYIEKLCQGVHALKGEGHAGDISEQKALNASGRVAAATVTDEPLFPGNPTGANQYQRREEFGNLPNSSQGTRVSQDTRAASNGISTRTQAKLDRLARERPDLLDKVRSGDLSAHGACVEAGWVPRRTPFDIVTREAGKMTDKDLERLSHWLEEERQRRAVACTQP